MRISIITINLNNKSGLKTTIESVINQTFKDFDFIIIDGASVDGSVDLIDQYKDKITYWISEPDKGIYNAMNKGIKQTSGDYCLFLNSGDSLISNDILHKVSYYLNDDDIIYGDAIRVAADKSQSIIVVPETPGLAYFTSQSLVHASSLIKKKLFEEFGLYNETNKIVSDWEFFIKTIVVNDVKAQKIPVIISVLEDNGISRLKESRPILNEEIDIVLNRYFSRSMLSLISEYKKMSLELKKIKRNLVFKIVLNLWAKKTKWQKRNN